MEQASAIILEKSPLSPKKWSGSLSQLVGDPFQRMRCVWLAKIHQLSRAHSSPLLACSDWIVTQFRICSVLRSRLAIRTFRPAQPSPLVSRANQNSGGSTTTPSPVNISAHTLTRPVQKDRPSVRPVGVCRYDDFSRSSISSAPRRILHVPACLPTQNVLGIELHGHRGMDQRFGGDESGRNQGAAGGGGLLAGSNRGRRDLVHRDALDLGLPRGPRLGDEGSAAARDQPGAVHFKWSG